MAIPKTARCRCGRDVEIRGGGLWTRTDGVQRDYWFAGGECKACYRIVQYGHAGTKWDYQHARFWYIGKHAESAPGMVRRWPAEWGYAEHLTESIQ